MYCESVIFRNIMCKKYQFQNMWKLVLLYVISKLKCENFVDTSKAVRRQVGYEREVPMLGFIKIDHEWYGMHEMVFCVKYGES